jgi:hypothetical protein
VEKRAASPLTARPGFSYRFAHGDLVLQLHFALVG